MSGVASIGNRAKLQTPNAMTPALRISMSHRCAIAARMSRSSVETDSVFIGNTRFLEIGFDEIALRYHDLFPWLQTFEDFHIVGISLPETHAPGRIGVTGACKHDGVILEGLK